MRESGNIIYGEIKMYRLISAPPCKGGNTGVKIIKTSVNLKIH